MTTTSLGFESTVRCPVDDDLLRNVYASDQDMYPAPLTFERLKSWVDACSDLSFCLRPSEGSPPIGVVIALPIRSRPHWDELLCGKLKETDIDPEVAFPTCDGAEEEVGLHVFHIERFPDNEDTSAGLRRGGFSEFVVAEIIRRATSKRQWKMVGLSALTATPAGKRAFQQQGFTPTGYSETFLVKEPEREGAENEVVMIPSFPDEAQQSSILSGDGSRILSQSEMTVKRMPTAGVIMA